MRLGESLMKNSVLALICVGIQLFAADYTLVQDILGAYPILEYNGNPRVGGILKVVADDNGVGLVVEPLKLSPEPAAWVSLLTPKDPTSITKEGNLITQQFHLNNQSLKIEYEKVEGMLDVRSLQCIDANCNGRRWIVSSGKAPGDEMISKDFLTSIQGLYHIESAGGIPPKPEISDAYVGLSLAKARGTITVPFCLPDSSCDPGEWVFPFDQTRVFGRPIGTRGELVVLLVSKPRNLLYYAWEKYGDGKIVFRNFQYLMDTELVYLEHVLTRK